MEDLALAMRSMGTLVTNQEVAALAKKYDRDNLGVITLLDFKQCIAEVQGKPDGADQIRSAFAIFDKYDSSGSMDLVEMKHILSRIGDPLTEEEIE